MVSAFKRRRIPRVLLSGNKYKNRSNRISIRPCQVPITEFMTVCIIRVGATARRFLSLSFNSWWRWWDWLLSVVGGCDIIIITLWLWWPISTARLLQYCSIPSLLSTTSRHNLDTLCWILYWPVRTWQIIMCLITGTALRKVWFRIRLSTIYWIRWDWHSWGYLVRWVIRTSTTRWYVSGDWR